MTSVVYIWFEKEVETTIEVNTKQNRGQNWIIECLTQGVREPGGKNNLRSKSCSRCSRNSKEVLEISRQVPMDGTGGFIQQLR